jgi:hypothetical protein
MNSVLSTLSKQTHFKSLAIYDNALDLESITHLGAILKKKMPENLEDLKLSHIKATPAVTAQLLTLLSTQRCFL